MKASSHASVRQAEHTLIRAAKTALAKLSGIAFD
jgi:hypothetical protein